MCTPGVCTAASIRGVWSADERNAECGAATTISISASSLDRHVDRAVGADIGLDAFEQPELARISSVEVHRFADVVPPTRTIDNPPAIGSPYE